MTARWRAALVGLVGAASVIALVTGCSEDAPPAESAPALARHLDRVDDAIADGDAAEARAAVDDLVATTAQAELRGDISEEEADRIIDAAREVLAELRE